MAFSYRTLTLVAGCASASGQVGDPTGVIALDVAAAGCAWGLSRRLAECQ